MVAQVEANKRVFRVTRGRPFFLSLFFFPFLFFSPWKIDRSPNQLTYIAARHQSRRVHRMPWFARGRHETRVEQVAVTYSLFRSPAAVQLPFSPSHLLICNFPFPILISGTFYRSIKKLFSFFWRGRSDRCGNSILLKYRFLNSFLHEGWNNCGMVRFLLIRSSYILVGQRERGILFSKCFRGLWNTGKWD